MCKYRAYGEFGFARNFPINILPANFSKMGMIMAIPVETKVQSNSCTSREDQILPSGKQIEEQIKALTAEEISTLAKTVVSLHLDRRGIKDKYPNSLRTKCMERDLLLVVPQMEKAFSTPANFLEKGCEVSHVYDCSKLSGETTNSPFGTLKINMDKTREEKELWFSFVLNPTWRREAEVVEIPPTSLYIFPDDWSRLEMDAFYLVGKSIVAEVDIKYGGQYLFRGNYGTRGLEELQKVIQALATMIPKRVFTYNTRTKMITLQNSSKLNIESVKKALAQEDISKSVTVLKADEEADVKFKF